MAHRYVFPIRDLERGMLEVHEAISSDWLAEALRDTDAQAVAGAAGQVDVTLMASGRDVVVRGSVRATVSLPCARCLRKTEIPVVGDLTLLLVPGKAPGVDRDKESSEAKSGESTGKKGKSGSVGEGASKGHARSHGKGHGKSHGKGHGKGHGKQQDDGHVFDSGEAELDTYVGDEVVLDGFLREAILLELPIFPLCSEACPGIGAVPSEATEPVREEEKIDPRLAPLLELKKT